MIEAKWEVEVQTDLDPKLVLKKFATRSRNNKRLTHVIEPEIIRDPKIKNRYKIKFHCRYERENPKDKCNVSDFGNLMVTALYRSSINLISMTEPEEVYL